MDNDRFDQLTRRLATTRSRRGLLAALVAGVAGVVAGEAAPEAFAIPCCGICRPPCTCVCNGPDDSFCECPSCEPISCDELCGVVDDGCGGTINCGCCPQGCDGRCGTVDDGCGGTLDCGCCPHVGCQVGQCGIVDDGCGGTLDCGCCPGHCEVECGTSSDGCGGTLDCGNCPSGQTCSDGRCVANSQDGDANEEPSETPIGNDTTSNANDGQDTGSGRRYVVLLDGFGSSSLLDDLTGENAPDNHGVRDRFAPIVRAVQDADPEAQFVYFSYRVGQLLASGKEPGKGWTGQRFGAGREPVYHAKNVTDRPLLDHVKGLDWIVGAVREQTPDAAVDLVGFGLGGVIALAWVADRMQVPDEEQADTLGAIRRVVVVNSPIGGINPRAVASPAAVEELIAFRFDPGNGALLDDLMETSDVVAALPDAAERVEAASIEHREDYVVNGERIFDTGPWLGKGTEEILPNDRRHETPLGAVEGDVLATHRLLLESPSDAAKEARDHLATLLE